MYVLLIHVFSKPVRSGMGGNIISLRETQHGEMGTLLYSVSTMLTANLNADMVATSAEKGNISYHMHTVMPTTTSSYQSLPSWLIIECMCVCVSKVN